MTYRVGLFGCVATLALTAATGASALGVTLTSVTASWQNPTPSSGIPITNGGAGDVSSVRWGDPAAPNTEQSGYDFNPFAPPSTGPFAFDEVFGLGEFTHLNFPIFDTADDPVLDDIELKLDYSLDINDGTTTTSVNGFSTYLFDHFETPNNGSPCAAGGTTPCPDLVTVSNIEGQTSDFEFGGATYSLFVSGFVDGGGSNVFQFLTRENAENTAILNAVVSQEVPVIPVPAALPLMLVGAGVFAGAARIKAKAKAAA